MRDDDGSLLMGGGPGLPGELLVVDDRLIVLNFGEFQLVGDSAKPLGQVDIWSPWYAPFRVEHGVAGGRYLAVLFRGFMPPFRNLAILDSHNLEVVASMHFHAGVRETLPDGAYFGMVPTQLVALGDCFYVLLSDGRVLAADFTGVAPEAAHSDEPVAVIVKDVPYKPLKSGPPDQLISLPGQPTVVAANSDGEIAVL